MTSSLILIGPKAVPRDDAPQRLQEVSTNGHSATRTALRQSLRREEAEQMQVDRAELTSKIFIALARSICLIQALDSETLPAKEAKERLQTLIDGVAGMANPHEEPLSPFNTEIHYATRGLETAQFYLSTPDSYQRGYKMAIKWIRNMLETLKLAAKLNSEAMNTEI